MSGISLGVDLATAPFIAAALQVYFVRLVAATHNAFPDLLVASEEIDATEDADRFCAGLESANI